MSAPMYVIASRTTRELFRLKLGDTIHWTDHALLASKYESASGAVIAASRMGISAGAIEIKLLAQDGKPQPLHMQDTRARMYLGGGR